MVTAKDAYGNTVSGYTGTIHFSSTDHGAVLPTDYPFVPGDNGTHTFDGGVTLNTGGVQTVTATDTGTPGITGIIVNVLPITDFANTAKTSSTATFSWTAASGATGIIIQQSLDGGTTWTTATTTSAIAESDTTATVTGLSPATSYKFRLVVTGGANVGNSNEVTVTTDAIYIQVKAKLG